MSTKVTRKQYEAARKIIEQCQNDSIRAQRTGNQKALNTATYKAARALAVIADYKNQIIHTEK